jgi:hypothetical protein
MLLKNANADAIDFDTIRRDKPVTIAIEVVKDGPQVVLLDYWFRRSLLVHRDQLLK